MTQPTPDRISRAARTLAYFEGSDAFDDPAQHLARDLYRTRVAALLARTRPVAPRRAAKLAERPDAVLGLSLNREVTAAHLAALSPDEIRALFGALHTIASIAQRTEARP